MHVKIEKGAAWLGLAMLVGFMVLFVLVARLIPPMDPSASAEQIAKIYSEHGLRIRIGLALMTLFSVFFTPYLALLSRQVRRIEGYWGVMSLTQVMLSVTFPFGFMLCSISAMAAAYRPERNPDVTQALNDVFWFIFVGLVGPLIFQVVVLAFAVFIDKRERPSFSALVRLLQHLVRDPRGAGLCDLSVQIGTAGVEWCVCLLDTAHGVQHLVDRHHVHAHQGGRRRVRRTRCACRRSDVGTGRVTESGRRSRRDARPRTTADRQR